MGAGACVIIIEGNGVQGDAAALALKAIASTQLIADLGTDLQAEAAKLAQTAAASCQLVDYLEHDEDLVFQINDTKPIQDFHLSTRKKLVNWTSELDKLNCSHDGKAIKSFHIQAPKFVALLTSQLDGLNRALAEKYNHPAG